MILSNKFQIPPQEHCEDLPIYYLILLRIHNEKQATHFSLLMCAAKTCNNANHINLERLITCKLLPPLFHVECVVIYFNEIAQIL